MTPSSPWRQRQRRCGSDSERDPGARSAAPGFINEFDSKMLGNGDTAICTHCNLPPRTDGTCEVCVHSTMLPAMDAA